MIDAYAAAMGIDLTPQHEPLAMAISAVDLAMGYGETNTSPLLKRLLLKIEELKFRVGQAPSLDQGGG